MGSDDPLQTAKDESAGDKPRIAALAEATEDLRDQVEEIESQIEDPGTDAVSQEDLDELSERVSELEGQLEEFEETILEGLEDDE